MTLLRSGFLVVNAPKAFRLALDLTRLVVGIVLVRWLAVDR